MHVGIRGGVDRGERLYHRARFLRAGGAIQEHEALAMYLLLQNRKLTS